jgi:hypothetical protein
VKRLKVDHAEVVRVERCVPGGGEETKKNKNTNKKKKKKKKKKDT